MKTHIQNQERLDRTLCGKEFSPLMHYDDNAICGNCLRIQKQEKKPKPATVVHYAGEYATHTPCGLVVFRLHENRYTKILERVTCRGRCGTEVKAVISRREQKEMA